MGNILGSIDPSLSPISSSSTNSTCSMSKREREEFQSLFTGDFNDDLLVLLNKFNNPIVPDFASYLYPCISVTRSKDSKFIEFRDIENYFGEAMRTTTEKLLHFIMDPLDIHLEKDQFNKKALVFISILFAYASNGNVQTSRIKDISTTVHFHYESYLTNSRLDDSFQSFKSWISIW